ncbi:MAG: hypothetical protein NTY19_16815, partial [Planctomycetota bacterium]|nr:hypothetical protein [Planctomycetota bacterium]
RPARRFNRLDPFAGKIQDPLSLHKYLYVHANPIGAVDPSGLLAGGGLSGTMVHNDVAGGDLPRTSTISRSRQ